MNGTSMESVKALKRAMKSVNRANNGKEFSLQVGRALRRAAKAARKTARMYGTPIYIWRDGKIVAEKPCY